MFHFQTDHWLPKKFSEFFDPEEQEQSSGVRALTAEVSSLSDGGNEEDQRETTSVIQSGTTLEGFRRWEWIFLNLGSRPIPINLNLKSRCCDLAGFMNIRKFRDLMTTAELYFCRADLFANVER